jgi:glycosyltransferase involved in cell wall biosynthesis
MRILMVSDFYPPFLGGVEVAVRNLSHELIARGHEVAVATLAAPDLPPFETVDGVPVHRVRASTQRSRRLFASSARPWAPPVPDPEAVVGLGRVLANHRPDIVHGHDWLARSVLPHKLTRGFKLVMSLHYYTLTCPKKNLMHMGREVCAGPALRKCLACAGQHYGRPKGAAVAVGQLAFGRAEAALVDMFLPVSRATARASGLGPRGPAFTVIPNLMPPADGSGAHDARLRELPAEPFLLFVGDVRGDKGASVLLESYRSLHDPPPLVLVGKATPETPTSLPSRAMFLRDWPNAVVRAAMQRCLALVVPSVWSEPFGLVVVESLAAGRPVVASRSGGIPEIVRDGQEGLLVPPSDTAALSAALRRIITDAALREAMAARAADRARQFRPDVVLPLVEGAYHEVLSRRRRSHTSH